MHLESSEGENDDAGEKYVDVKVCNAKEDSTDNFPLNKMSVEKKDIKNIHLFIVALKYLSYPEYYLVDTYPTLIQVFAIAVAYTYKFYLYRTLVFWIKKNLDTNSLNDGATMVNLYCYCIMFLK